MAHFLQNYFFLLDWLIAAASHKFITLLLASRFFAQKILSIHWYGFARFWSGLALSSD